MVSDDLVLYKSMFGTGWILGGYNSNITPENTRIQENAHHISHASISIRQAVDVPDPVRVVAHHAKHSISHSGPAIKKELMDNSTDFMSTESWGISLPP